MVNYVRLAATAERLITKNGRSVTVTKLDRVAADPTKPWLSGGTTTDSVSAIAVVIPIAFEEADGTNVKRGDAEAFVSHTENPTKNLESYDTLTTSDETWEIMNIVLLNPGGVRLMYHAHLRR
jgi:hypothetical protein